MTAQAAQSAYVERDRLASRLAELARLLADPTARNIETVRSELARLGQG